MLCPLQQTVPPQIRQGKLLSPYVDSHVCQHSHRKLINVEISTKKRGRCCDKPDYMVLKLWEVDLGEECGSLCIYCLQKRYYMEMEPNGPFWWEFG